MIIGEKPGPSKATKAERAMQIAESLGAIATWDAGNGMPPSVVIVADRAVAVAAFKAVIDAWRREGYPKDLSFCLRMQDPSRRPLKHEALSPGTIVRNRHTGSRVRVTGWLGGVACCEYVRKDGRRDNRYTGWSGDLRLEDWVIDNTTSKTNAARRGP